jgi:hypothetical protein
MRRFARQGRRIAAGLLVVACVLPPLSDARAAETTLTVAFHVHSDVSTGGLSLDQIADRARSMGIDAVVFSENLALRYEYGLFPFQGIIRHTVTLPSLVEYGIERYLAAVAGAQARHPDVLLVPGVEVTPHYYWTGSLPGGNLTMHNSQKNILVLGLAQARDYAALPAPGTEGFTRYGWETIGSVWPAALFVPAAMLWWRKAYRDVKVGVTKMRVVKRFRVPAGILAGVAATLLILAWPYGQPLFSFYDDRLQERPYQALIDTVNRHGGLAIWSMPEAVDFNVYPYGPLGSVTVKTDPYPLALIQTTGYAGFGGVYQDTRTITEPGGLWDRLLLQHLGGQRSAVPWQFGEIAFHNPGQGGIELNQVLNIVRVRERTAAGLVEAMRNGRFHAVSNAGHPFGLRLGTFRVDTQDGQRSSAAGETLARAGAEPLAVRVAVTATDRGAHPIQVTIVRSGQVLAKLSGTTPFEHRMVDTGVPAGASAFYRVDVRGSGEILSNPIFVRGG